jgi:short-subunit dehydrogenase
MARWRRALITGASAGIGEAIARQLAADGVDLVLVARRAERLEVLADQLRSSLTRVDVLTADLAQPAGVATVAARLAAADEPIDLLVNNAGFGGHGRFWQQPIDHETSEINVNVTALVQLTHAALAHMVPEGRGAIMNVSSVAGFRPGPTNAVYSATKAFVTNFSEAVAIELAGTGVTVTAVCPGLTHTEFHAAGGFESDVARVPRLFWMSADEVARQALEATEQGKVVHVTGGVNRALAVLMQATPGRPRRAVAKAVVRFRARGASRSG